MDEYIAEKYNMYSIAKNFNVDPKLIGYDIYREENYLWALIFIRVDNEIEAERFST